MFRHWQSASRVLALCIVAVITGSALAQEPTPTEDAAKRVEKLEAEVKKLRTDVEQRDALLLKALTTGEYRPIMAPDYFRGEGYVGEYDFPAKRSIASSPNAQTSKTGSEGTPNVQGMANTGAPRSPATTTSTPANPGNPPGTTPGGGSTQLPDANPNIVTYRNLILQVALVVAVLLFGIFVLILQLFLIKKNDTRWDATMILRFNLIGVVLIAGLLLVVAGYSELQIASMMGLLGTVAGYLLGARTTHESPGATSTVTHQVAAIPQASPPTTAPATAP